MSGELSSETVPRTLDERTHEAARKSPLSGRIRSVRQKMQKFADALEVLETGVGVFPHVDEIVARRLDAIERALGLDHDHVVVHRDVILTMVRERGRLLAKDRRKPKKARQNGERPLTAGWLADELINYQGPPALYPWLAKMAEARKELVAAIEAKSHKARDTESREQTLLKKLDLPRVGSGAGRQHRYRAKRHAPK